MRSLAVLLLVAGWAMPSQATGKVEGHARIPMVLTHPDQGYVELYEWDAWLTPDGDGENRVRRTGAMPMEGVTHDGHYSFFPTAGSYSLLVHQPEWWVRPCIVPNVEVSNGETLAVHAEPPADYAMAFGNNMGPWQGAGDPWDWAAVWNQTFVAKSTSITKVQFKLAGTQTESVRVSIHEANGDDDPSGWPQVGPERVLHGVGTMGDNWIGWLSEEVPTRPGQRYAVRLADAAGKGTIGPFVHRDAVSPGYEGGQAWKDGEAMEYDLYMVISGDSDGTLIAYGKRIQGKPAGFAGWGQSWGQTWQAKGRSLAALDLFAAAGSSDGSARTVALVRIFEGGPGGKQIGPTKKSNMAWWGPGTGILGISYNPGEVPLEPGKTYYAELEGTYPLQKGAEGPGFSPMPFSQADNRYAGGHAVRDRVAQPDTDLEMTIVEWTTSPERKADAETLTPPDPARNLLPNGDFNDGTPGRDNHPVPTGWAKWNTRPTAWWYEEEFGRNGTLGVRLIGGSINGTNIQGGIVRRVEGLDAKTQYRLSGWVNSSHLTSHMHAAYIGFDPTGQTGNALAPTVVWLEAGAVSNRFEQILSPPITPVSDAVSVWVRAENPNIHDTFTVDFDDLILEVWPE